VIKCDLRRLILTSWHSSFWLNPFVVDYIPTNCITIATGIIDGVGQYDHVKETFVSYTERLEMFCLGNYIVEVAGNSEKQIAARKAVSERKTNFLVKSVQKLTPL